MGTLRRVWRTLALTVWTVGMFAILVLVSVLRGLSAGQSWLGPAAAHFRTRQFHRWARGVVRLLDVRVAVNGTPPSAPFFLVSNHLSYLDVVVFASCLPCVFVAKSEVASWPMIGTLCRSADTLFIDRESKRDIPRVMERIQGTLGGGRGVVVFPEGFSTQGAEVLRFRPSLLEIAARAGIPVSYAALSYRTPVGSAPAHLAVCWWGEMTFVSHLIELLGLPSVEASLTFGEAPIQERDRKELARQLHRAVAQRFEPVVALERA